MCKAHKGISLAQLAATARGDEKEVLVILQNMMERFVLNILAQKVAHTLTSGLCYSNKDMYFPL